MHGGAKLGEQPRIAAQHGAEHLAGGLDGAACPASLLLLKREDALGELVRSVYAGAVFAAPAAQCGAVAEVEILGQRVNLPAARVVNASAPPEPTRTIEVEPQAIAAAHLLLHEKVNVVHHGLRAGDETVLTIKVGPAGLGEAGARVGEGVLLDQDAAQPVDGGNEVGVEECDELAFDVRHGGGECAGLVAAAIGAVPVFDVEAGVAEFADDGGGEISGVVGGVVEHLNLKAVAGPIERGGSADYALGDVVLVKDR